jgi:mannose-6-phosphate isomerase-like protein (cupin superfamily)
MVRPQIHENFSRLPSDQAGRPLLEAIEPDAHPERGFSGAHGQRKYRRAPLAVAAQEREPLHKHIRAEEFYFVLEGTGRMRVGEETLTVPRYGGVLVGPDQLRQVFNDSDAEALWLIIGAPEEMEFLKGSLSQMDLSLIYPLDPKQLPTELAGIKWPPEP